MSSERTLGSAAGMSHGDSDMSASATSTFDETTPAPARPPLAVSDEALHSAVAEGSAKPPVHTLLTNLDTRGLQGSEWRLAAEVKMLADRGVTGKDITGLLTTCGLKDSEAQKVLAFAKTAQKAYAARPVFAELAAELRLAYFFSEHYDLDSDSYDVEERRPTNRNLIWRLHRMVEACEELADVRPEELRASGFGIQDLFHRDARTVDGVVVQTRLDIARWLNGPYANVRKTEELKKVLPKLDLDLTADLDANESPSSQLNLAAWSVLKADRLFCVFEEHEDEKLEPHAHLTFFPHDGSTPLLLDFSFHQLFPKEGLKSPFVGTESELSALAKTHKAQGRVTSLFAGHARTPACQNVTPEVIHTIRQALSAKEADATYN
jgi:hypothetical protein